MTPDIQKKIEVARSQGYNDAQIYAYLQKKGVKLEQPDDEEPSRTFGERIFGVAEAINRFTGGTALSERLGSAIGQAGVLKDVITSGGDKEKLAEARQRSADIKADMPSAKETLGSAMQVGSMLIPVGGVAGAASKAIKAAGTSERAARTIGTMLSGGGAGYVYDAGKGMEEGTGYAPSWGTAFGVAVPAGFALKDTLLRRTVGHATSQTFRAVKPTITNKRNLRTLKDRMERANVEIVNHGYKPTNLQEYADAIDKTKQSVWKKVQAKMGQRAGDQITLDTIASKLKVMAADPNISRLDPRGGKRIQALAEALVSQGKRITIQDAEKLKQFVNAQLEGAYGQMNISKVEQEARKLITREIGEQLDSILSSVPNEFQELKRSYGALREIEEDVIRRIVVFERQNPAGLFDGLGSMAGIANIVRGMLTASPGAAVQGATELTMGMAIKRMNNADNLVRKAFENISKQVSPKPFFYSPGDAIMDGSLARFNKAKGGAMGMSIKAQYGDGEMQKTLQAKLERLQKSAETAERNGDTAKVKKIMDEFAEVQKDYDNLNAAQARQ